MVGVSASVNLLLHHKVRRFSSGTSSPGSSRKKGCKTVVVVKVKVGFLYSTTYMVDQEQRALTVSEVAVD